MPTLVKKPAAKQAVKATAKSPITKSKIGFEVSRSSSTGRFLINGVDERKLVNQFPPISIRPSPGKPKHFTASEIADMVKMMKVA